MDAVLGGIKLFACSTTSEVMICSYFSALFRNLAHVQTNMQSLSVHSAWLSLDTASFRNVRVHPWQQAGSWDWGDRGCTGSSMLELLFIVRLDNEHSMHKR